MKSTFSGLRWLNVWITESGGTTGISLSIREARRGGERMCECRDSEGSIIRACGERANIQGEYGCRVREWRTAGMRDQVWGKLSVKEV
jgi:hypothetical protein